MCCPGQGLRRPLSGALHQAVRELGCQVVVVLALVDRLQGARALFREHGIEGNLGKSGHGTVTIVINRARHLAAVEDLDHVDASTQVVDPDAVVVEVRRPHVAVFGTEVSDLGRQRRVCEVDDAGAARVPGDDRLACFPYEVQVVGGAPASVSAGESRSTLRTPVADRDRGLRVSSIETT